MDELRLDVVTLPDGRIRFCATHTDAVSLLHSQQGGHSVTVCIPCRPSEFAEWMNSFLEKIRELAKKGGSTRAERSVWHRRKIRGRSRRAGNNHTNPKGE